MSNARNDLARLMFESNAHTSGGWENVTRMHTLGGQFAVESAYAQADAFLGAGYAKLRTIATLADLEALPVESVVLIRGNMVMEKFSDGWYTTVIRDPYRPFTNWLPATLIYTPKEDTK